MRSVGSAIGLFVFVVVTACGQNVVLPGPVPHPASDPPTLTSTPTDAQIREWLRSNDPRLIAWGAHAILEQRKREHLPELVQIISRWEQAHPQSQWDSAHLDALIAMLDAVVQLDGRMTPADIRQALARDGNSQLEQPLLVLLVRLPAAEARPVWQSIMFSSNIYSAAARLAADVLSKNPPPGFAATLLDKLTEFAEVTVTDPDARWGHGPVGSWPTGCITVQPTREDWPNIGVYVLSDSPAKSGSTLLVDEIDPVYVTRLQMSVDELRQGYWCSGHTVPIFTYLTEERRVKIIGRLIGANSDEMPITVETHLSIDFLDVKAYQAQVDALVHRQSAQYTSVLGQLCARGLMTADERSTTVLRMQVDVSDLRKSDQPPLPTLHYGYDIKVFYRRN